MTTEQQQRDKSFVLRDDKLSNIASYKSERTKPVPLRWLPTKQMRAISRPGTSGRSDKLSRAMMCAADDGGLVARYN